MMVRRLSRLLITLPLLAVPMAGLTLKPATAAGVAAEEAVRILSKARTADTRCKFLSAAERSELSRYTARAEIAAATQASPKAAKAASASGTAQGQSGACSPDLKADVLETLGAAREAIAAAEPAEPRAVTSAAPRKATAKVQRAGAIAEKPRRTGSEGLSRYARVVQAYYLERECRSLSKAKASAFWKGIVRLHKTTVAANGASAVAPVMRSAERQAGGSSCGGKAKATIMAGYEEITSR